MSDEDKRGLDNNYLNEITQMQSLLSSTVYNSGATMAPDLKDLASSTAEHQMDIIPSLPLMPPVSVTSTCTSMGPRVRPPSGTGMAAVKEKLSRFTHMSQQKQNPEKIK